MYAVELAAVGNPTIMGKSSEVTSLLLVDSVLFNLLMWIQRKLMQKTVL